VRGVLIPACEKKQVVHVLAFPWQGKSCFLHTLESENPHLFSVKRVIIVFQSKGSRVNCGTCGVGHTVCTNGIPVLPSAKLSAMLE